MNTAYPRNSVCSTWLTTLAACALVGACAAARAEVPSDTADIASSPDAPSLTVSYHNLDFTTTQGSAALYGRINDAARKVCVVNDIRDLKAVAASRACEHAAVTQAVREVHGALMAARR